MLRSTVFSPEPSECSSVGDSFRNYVSLFLDNAGPTQLSVVPVIPFGLLKNPPSCGGETEICGSGAVNASTSDVKFLFLRGD